MDTDSTIAAIPYFGYGLVALALLMISYEYLLHPLRNFPGPFIAKFTNGYGAFHAMRRSLHIVTWREHLRYGPVIRQGPNKLVFNTASALNQIYHNERITKPITYLSNQSSPGAFNTWNSLNRDLHRQKRKLVGQAVNERSMRAFEPTMREQVDVLIQTIARSQGHPMDMKRPCNYLGMDVVNKLSFGFTLNSQTDEKYRFLADEMAPGNRRLNVYMQIPTIAKYRLQTAFNLIWYKSREKVWRLLELMIKNRMSQDQHARHDLYSFVADALKAEQSKNLRMQDLWMEAILFTVAGGDSTATAIAATFFYIARHRDCYQRVSQEVRSVFEHGGDICGSGLSKCHYLRACIDESLRMSPPIPGTLWRQLAPEENNGAPLIVDGHVIPRDTYVGVNTYSIHHHEDYFPDPFTYNPDRWLESKCRDNTPGSREVIHAASNPFSTGSRGCAGKAMAYLEISLVLAKALWYYDFEPAPGRLGNIGLSDKGEFHIYDVLISTHDGPWLVFRPRSTLSQDFPELDVQNV
ncbi:cytochrome P450 [Xylariomycetidae sp. FL2044]|nr:cytochrome P450 [Xylariomycetidae sp. FL2044]